MKPRLPEKVLSKSLPLTLFFALIFISTFLQAQQKEIDRLRNLIANSQTDTAKIPLLENLGWNYEQQVKTDSSVLCYTQALELNQKHNYSLQKQYDELLHISGLYYYIGSYDKSIKYIEQLLKLSEDAKNLTYIGFSHLEFGLNYTALGDYGLALAHYFQAKQILKGKPENDTAINLSIGDLYLKLNKPDSALIFAKLSFIQSPNSLSENIISYKRLLGDIYNVKGDDQIAINYYKQYISDFREFYYYYSKGLRFNRELGSVFIATAKIFQKEGKRDSAIFYAKKALVNAKEFQDEQNIYTASKMLSDLYQSKDNFKDSSIFTQPKLAYNKIERFKIDSLKKEFKVAEGDSLKVTILEALSQEYVNEVDLDSAIQVAQQRLALVEKSSLPVQWHVWALATLEYLTFITSNYSLCLKYATQALPLSEQIHDYPAIASVYTNIAAAYAGMKDFRKAIEYYFKSKKVWEINGSPIWAVQNIAEIYLEMHMPDSALYYNKIAYHLADTSHKEQYMKDFAIRVYGAIYQEKGEDELAIKYYHQFIKDYYHYNLNNREIDRVYFGISQIYRKNNQKDSAIFYAKKGLTAAQIFNDQEHIYLISDFLSQLHDSISNASEALAYFKIAQAAKDSMASIEKIRQIQNLAYQEQVREKEQADADAKEKARNTLIITIAAIIVAIVTFLVWNRIRQLRLKHKMILEQKEAEKLKAIDRMKEKFFTNITHELRTPLSLILSPAEFYLQHPEEMNDQRKFLKTVYKNSNYLLNLINQLLDISKLDSGKMNVSLYKGNFGNYIGELVKTFEEESKKKNVDLHFGNNLNKQYLFDAEHWKKIINNLMSNALKFTPANRDIFVSIHEVSSSGDADTIRLIVKDTGIGINKEQLPFITDRFYQADNNLTRKFEGTGIGLSLVNELVKLMNGKLEIESEEGKGSTFKIIIPLLSANGKSDFPDVPALAASIQFSNNGATEKTAIVAHNKNIPVILLTEDNPGLREFLESSLEPLYKVLTASDGAEGFEMALSEIPDLIISDVMMPVMDGFEFCDKIKEHPATSHIPFIILTAKTTYESKITGLQKGADDYLNKPFSVDELRTKIHNMLERQNKLRRHYLDQLTSADPLPVFSNMRDEFLRNTYKIIEEHIDDSQLSVEFLAGKMALNGHALNRKFSSLLGLTANELIRQFRMKKSEMEHEMLELDAKALRAQMNPHFIFNCMNSIKSLIQEKEDEKAIIYLTTFSRLIRSIFQNSDKKEISLYDEIETCRLYTQLESMRFGSKFNYNFYVDETLDLKSVQVPSLVIQPFIENAIWHGIMPKEDGGYLNVSVERQDGSIYCIVDDDGIGREMSRQNKFRGDGTMHESKGMRLTQNRLDLHNALNESNASVEIIDKKDANGIATGTTIILFFKEY